jgi:peptidoglycan/LPS O-acetylase OafA/YrhL
MVAVVAVILDHMLDWPTGGFVGVDVFFVISGFLITGLLLRERDRTGGISFAGFYRRRVRRILPAAVLVLFVSVAGAYFLFNSGRFQLVLADSVWALLFSANWHFLAAGTDYFAAAGPVSPVQHFWSLAVEEQFYLVWPWLILLGYAAVRSRRRGTHGHRLVFLVMVLVTAASFGWAVYETATSPTWAYFSTFSRAWELGIGALVAVAGRRLSRIPDRLRPLLAYLGLLGIGVAIFVTDADAGFPAPAAALPVLSAALLIAAGSGGPQRFLWPLTNPVSVWLGDLSYSLYLWHFPVIILLSVLVPTGSWQFVVLVSATTLVLASASYYGVEDPVRRSRFLEPRGRGATRAPALLTRAELRRRRRHRRALALTAVAAVLTGTAGWAMSVLPPPTASAEGRAATAASPPSDAAPAPVAATLTTEPAPIPVAQLDLTARLQQALDAAEWPELAPSVDELGGTARAPEWYEDDCLNVWPESAARCAWGPPEAEKTVLVVGDSLAISYAPAIRAALEPDGYAIQSLTFNQCPAAVTEVDDFEGHSDFHDFCRAHTEWVLSEIAARKPDIVIASSSVLTLVRLASGASGADAIAEWQSGATAFLSRLPAPGRTVIVLDPPPLGEKLLDCYDRFSAPSDCIATVDPTYTEFVTATAAAADASGVTHVPTAGWFCVDGRCPSFVGNTPVFADGQHLTGAYSSSLAPVLREVVAAAQATARSG